MQKRNIGSQGASFGNKRKFPEDASADLGCQARSAIGCLPTDSFRLGGVQGVKQSACCHRAPKDQRRLRLAPHPHGALICSWRLTAGNGPCSQPRPGSSSEHGVEAWEGEEEVLRAASPWRVSAVTPRRCSQPTADIPRQFLFWEASFSTWAAHGTPLRSSKNTGR